MTTIAGKQYSGGPPGLVACFIHAGTELRNLSVAEAARRAAEAANGVLRAAGVTL
jgi:hypothetical protein